jgi:hypothetical protein
LWLHGFMKHLTTGFGLRELEPDRRRLA